MIADEITVGNLISAGIAAAVPIGTSVVSFLMIGRKVRRENEADVDAKIAPLRQDLASIAGKVEQHVPRREIEEADRVVRAVADGAVREVGELRDQCARLDERQKSLGGKLTELTTLVKDQGRETKADFEKVQDCLREIIRKVG